MEVANNNVTISDKAKRNRTAAKAHEKGNWKAKTMLKYGKEYTGETKLWISETEKWHRSTKVSNTVESQGNSVAYR